MLYASWVPGYKSRKKDVLVPLSVWKDVLLDYAAPVGRSEEMSYCIIDNETFVLRNTSLYQLWKNHNEKLVKYV